MQTMMNSSPVFQSDLCNHRLQPGAGDSRRVFERNLRDLHVGVGGQPVLGTELRGERVGG